MRSFILFGLMLLFVSCTSESERFLEEKLATERFDFTNLKNKGKSIQYNLNSGLQYGIITLNDAEKVKFWFVNHHQLSDKGGTIYEFTNGERKFISGMHCCEVQFNDIESLNNLSTFKNYLESKNGRFP